MATTEKTNDERMAELTREFYARAEEIRRDPALSDRGRADRLEQLWTSTTEVLDRLEADGRDAALQRTRALHRQLFGTAKGDPVAHRDAADRAAKLARPEQARAALARASDAGDKILELAVFGHAVRQAEGTRGSAGWDQLVSEYAEQNDLADELGEYLALTGTASRTARLQRHFALRPQLPRELQGRRRRA